MRAILLYLIILTTCVASIFGEEKELRFHHLTTENGLSRNTVYSVVMDKYGFIWLATLDGLYRFDGYKMKVYKGEPRNPKSPLNNRPLKLSKDSKGDIWISFSSHHLLCRYNYQTDDFTRVSRSGLSPMLKLLYDSNSRSTWTAENSDFKWDVRINSLVQFNKKNKQQIVYRYNPKNDYGLNDEKVLGLYLDSHNTLWVATDAGGVSFANVDQPKFDYFHIESSLNRISETSIRAICQSSEGDLWIGTRQSGFAKISRRDNQITYFRHSEKNPNSVSNDEIRKLYTDKYGILWIGTKGGVNSFNTKTNRFKHYPPLNSTNWIYAIEEDDQNNLWIGTWRGVARYDREKDKFIPYILSNPWRTYRIRTLLKEGKSSLWIGTEGDGLTLLTRILVDGKEKVSCTTYKNNTGKPKSLSDDRIFSLCKDRFGYLWIGTGGGLNRFDPRSGQFLHFHGKRFISDGMILGIVNDGDYLWVSHPNGLTRIDSRTFVTCNFTSRDDLFGNEFSEDAYFRNSKSGECFFGGNLGLISFYPKGIKTNPFPPRVVVSDLRISNKSVFLNQSFNGRIILQRPLYLTKSVKLEWGERNIDIEFAALHYANPPNNTYSYRLVGFDKEWKNTDATSRVASYTNLPSGKYLFEVKAANPDGVWVKSPTTLEIVILPPWWRTWWAYLIYIMVIAGLIYLAFRIIMTREKLNHQIQIERLKAEKIKELDELKSRFFTNVSHELRTPLTLIIDPIEKLIEGKDIDNKTSRYFFQLISDNSKRLLSLVNQLLDLKKVESGGMTLDISFVDVVSRIGSLVGMFELKAKERDIKLEFESVPDSLMTGLDVDKLDKIVINLLSNAFKFTPEKGRVSVKILPSNDKKQFVITIEDSGIGIPPTLIDKVFDPFYQVDSSENRYGTGIGLSLVKDFVELHQGSIQVDSKEGQGSCFKLTFPIRENQGNQIPTVGDHSLPFDSIPEGKDSQGVPEEGVTTDENKELPLVLIVEDNKDVRDYLVKVLQDKYRVCAAENGMVGLNQAFENIPDLILSDIMMPELGGVELCERLKTDQRTSHIPVVLLTARQAEELKIKSFETGADDYITKPFNSSTLLARIKNLIDSREKLRLLYDQSTGFNTRVIAVNQVDKIFMDNILIQIHENMTRVTFDLEELASILNMTRVQLNRKIKSLTNKTTQEFVLTVRLNKAADLLLSGLHTVAEVSEMVGYSEPGNFTRSFTRQFGESPKNYVANHRQ